MNRSDHAKEIARLHPDLKLGTEVQPGRARCSGKCLRLVEVGDLRDGLCIDCFDAVGQEKAQGTLRKLAFERDRGKCFACRLDTEVERAEIEQMREWEKSSDARHAQLARNRLAYYREQRGYIDTEISGEKSLWELHHLKEKARGGPNTLENGATACAPCHAKLTGDFSRIRKVAKKPQRRFGR